jgi:hypothetical protein
MQGSEKSGCGIGDPMGNQAQSLEDVVRGYLPGSGAGPIAAACWGRAAGELRLNNQGHAFVGELLRNQLFRPFRLSRRWIPKSCVNEKLAGVESNKGKQQSEDHWRKRHDLNLSKTLGVMSGDKPRGFPICSSPL